LPPRKRMLLKRPPPMPVLKLIKPHSLNEKRLQRQNDAKNARIAV
jgi:hypothetical protein